MNNITVSVIIPNYNHAQFLRERIDSILNQTFQDFEIIILDDCSSDNSMEIISNYKTNPKISHIVRNEENSGCVFSQWEKGFQLSQGKYIWIAESDDYITTDFLSTAIEAFHQEENATLCFCDSTLVDQNGNTLKDDWDRWGGDSSIQIYSSDEFIKKGMIWKNCIYNASSVIFKKESLKSIQKEYLSMKYCGDWYFWIEIIRQGKVIRIHQKMNFFRQHNNKVSPKAEAEGLQFLEGIKVVKHALDTIGKPKWTGYASKGCIQRRLYRFKKQFQEKQYYKIKNVFKEELNASSFLCLASFYVHKSFCKTWRKI